jgi:hypothetical protein
MAPRSASPSPNRAPSEADLSPKLINALPKIERQIPEISLTPGRSLIKIQDPIPTKIGWVFTRTTELATEVYLRELIQKAKWRLRRTPERSNHPISDFLQSFQTFRRHAKGSTIREAKTIR